MDDGATMRARNIRRAIGIVLLCLVGAPVGLVGMVFFFIWGHGTPHATVRAKLERAAIVQCAPLNVQLAVRGSIRRHRDEFIVDGFHLFYGSGATVRGNEVELYIESDDLPVRDVLAHITSACGATAYEVGWCDRPTVHGIRLSEKVCVGAVEDTR